MKETIAVSIAYISTKILKLSTMRKQRFPIVSWEILKYTTEVFVKITRNSCEEMNFFC